MKLFTRREVVQPGNHFLELNIGLGENYVSAGFLARILSVSVWTLNKIKWYQNEMNALFHKWVTFVLQWKMRVKWPDNFQIVKLIQCWWYHMLSWNLFYSHAGVKIRSYTAPLSGNGNFILNVTRLHTE